MWIIKKMDEPGKDYGQYRVGYFEPIGGDYIFRSIGEVYPDKPECLERAARFCNYLNGGTDVPVMVHQVSRILEVLQQVSDNLVKKMTFKDW